MVPARHGRLVRPVCWITRCDNVDVTPGYDRLMSRSHKTVVGDVLIIGSGFGGVSPRSG